MSSSEYGEVDSSTEAMMVPPEDNTGPIQVVSRPKHISNCDACLRCCGRLYNGGVCLYFSLLVFGLYILSYLDSIDLELDSIHAKLEDELVLTETLIRFDNHIIQQSIVTHDELLTIIDMLDALRNTSS